MLKVNIKNTRAMSCSKLTIKTPEQRQAFVFIVKFEYDFILVILLLTLNIFNTFFSVFIAAFEQENVSWELGRSLVWQVITL